MRSQSRLLVAVFLAGAACGDARPVETPPSSPSPPSTPVSPSGAPSTPSSAPVTVRCPELSATYLPAGFTLAIERQVGSGPGIVGIGRTYIDDLGREISIESGVPGEVGGRPTGEIIEVRGYRATMTRAGDTINAVWFEAPVEAACHQYWVTTVGLSIEEFRAVMAGIR